MEIQVVSDIHVEFWENRTKFNFIKPVAPYLALLGDIGVCSSDDDFDRYKLFIMENAARFKQIFVIPGNHEYYCYETRPTLRHTLPYVNRKIRNFIAGIANVHFLNNSVIKLNINRKKYWVIGSTMWTNIPKIQHKNINKLVNDYNYILMPNGRKGIRKFTPADASKLHNISKKYVATQIKYAKDAHAKIIVLTHHKPYLNITHDASSRDIAYESNLLPLIKHVSFWGYGHTHKADLKKIGNAIVYSNPKGYPRQQTKFNPSYVITIK